MKHRIVVGLVCLGLAIAVSHASAGQTAARRARGPVVAPGGAVITGRVFDGGTNTPLRRVQVQALNDESDVEAITDEEGRYQITGLRPGQWRVVFSKAGYFGWELGQERPFESPPKVLVKSGQRLNADIRLSRGGVIAGRVFDETGEALAGLRVRVYRARMSQGYRRLEAVGSADFTDDTGAYRVYGLPPGDYFVTASLRMAPVDALTETTYSPTYYPGTGDLAEAQRIRVALGSEATAIFPLLPIRHVRVSGSVATSAGTPGNAFLSLTSETAEFGVPLGIGGVTREDGTFAVPDVPPGHYTLTASLRGDGPSETASIPLNVASDDISGVTLVTNRPAVMRGRFAMEAGVTRPMPGGLDVVANAAHAGGNVLSSGHGPAFQLDELSEPFHLRVSGLPDGWSVKAIVVNGQDVTDSTIVIPLGDEADGRIVLTDRGASVDGTVTLDGRTTKAQVVIFPEDQTKWSYPSRYVRVASTDAQGRFHISGLPAERYLAIAATYLEDQEQHDPEFLERMREGAARFDVEEAEKRSIDLTVVER